MITNVVQRWREGRTSYRPRGEVINTQDYEVAEIGQKVAKAFVVRHHYAKSFPAPRFLVGLFRRGGQLSGVAAFSHPMQDRVLDVLPCPRNQSAELGRFILLDDVPANGESWFLARSFELALRHGISGVVSFSDPLPRTNAAGQLIKPGHVGTIYRATNAVFAGRGSPASLKLLPDGTILSPRAISKIRKFDRNWRPAARVLERFGATTLTERDDPIAWLRKWVPALTRPMRHPGNFRYLFGLEKATRKRLPASLPYPTVTA